MSASATATAGSLALGGNRGAHPTLRLDSFLRSTDAGYQHAESQVRGDHFIRKMTTYGQVRPSVSFMNEPRVLRPVKVSSAVDMSGLPAPWNDPRDDPREGTLVYPPPPKDIDDSFLKMYDNHSLMLPSERYKEHLHMKAATEKWREDRERLFNYRKRMNVLERCHPEGVVGIDGPMHPGTQLYATRHTQLREQAERKAAHAEDRFALLAERHQADEVTQGKFQASAPDLRGPGDPCVRQKSVNPHRHMDTHSRLFPDYQPAWDPERARAHRSHDVRGKSYNIINGSDNALSYHVAKRWDEDIGAAGAPSRSPAASAASAASALLQ